jgi:hypothetical protein
MPLTPPRYPPRHVRQGESQPEPAGIEPGPSEVNEDLRGQRDDVIRGLMAILAELGSDGLYDGITAEQLTGLGDPSKHWHWTQKLYYMLSGQQRQVLTGGWQVGAGESLNYFPEEIRAGQLFIVRAIRTLAPASTKVALYLNNTAPTSFVEVITAAQEFSGLAPGELVIVGPAQILVKASGAASAGSLIVKLEGDLVDRQYLSR